MLPFCTLQERFAPVPVADWEALLYCPAAGVFGLGRMTPTMQKKKSKKNRLKKACLVAGTRLELVTFGL